MTLNDDESPKLGLFVIFFCDFGLQHTF